MNQAFQPMELSHSVSCSSNIFFHLFSEEINSTTNDFCQTRRSKLFKTFFLKLMDTHIFQQEHGITGKVILPKFTSTLCASSFGDFVEN